MSGANEQKPAQVDVKSSSDATTTVVASNPDQIQSSAVGNTMLNNLANKKNDQSGAIVAAATGSQMTPINEHLANMVQQFFQGASQDLIADV